MNLTRRTFLSASAIWGSFVVGFKHSNALETNTEDVAKGANGLYVQPWFEDSFLDLNDELNEASANNQQLVLIYEQSGCPYCKELHKVNLAKPSIRTFMQKHFRVVQLDIKGSREVTDFAGKSMSEREFSRLWNIHFTPTLSFFPRDKSKVIGKSGKEAEAFRLTGYWKPFHFETVLHFVHSGSYKQDNLQSYLSDRVKALQKNGEKINIWNE